MPSQHFQHTAYTLLANPFVHTRNSPSAPLMNGPVAARDVLRLHLQQLGATFSDLAAILLVMPQSPGPQPTEEVPGYRNVTELDIGYVGPTPLEVIAVGNNTLGSYGLYLHAFAATRGRFDYYIFCEDDYVPAVHFFDRALVRLHDATFAQGRKSMRSGVLAGLLQGKPAEPNSRRALHLETSHIMSAASLGQLFKHLYTTIGWRGSTAERMLHLVRERRNGTDNRYYGGGIQEGFGMLCAEAGIELRDWSRTYRSPYWNHKHVVDWSGATSNFTLPMARALFVPIQMVFGELKFAKSCCEPSEAACRGAQRACAVDLNLLWGARGSDCCASSTTRSGGGAEWRETRLQLSVPEATTRSDASFARFHSGAAGLQGMGRMPTEHNLGWEWGLYE